MSKKKFTPGPLRVYKGDFEKAFYVILDKRNRYVADFYWSATDKESQKADANLYAAAPEMYEQLDFFLDTIKKHFPERGAIIEKILKKARGESEAQHEAR